MPIHIIERAIIQRKIKRANGDFSRFMSRNTSANDVERVLNYAAKKANSEQQLVASVKKH